MYKTVDSTQFISLIRTLDDSVKNIRLSGIEVDKTSFSVKYVFICDETVTEEVKNKILDEVEKVSPPVFKSVNIVVKKIVSNAELINGEIYKFVKDNYPSLSIFLKPTDVVTAEVGSVVKYVIKLTKDGAEYAIHGGVIQKLNDYLSKRFCSEFAGSTEIKEAEETVSLLSDEVFENEIQKIEYRTIKVKDVVVIDDMTMGNVALYIEDAVDGEVTVCGTITEITERETKTGKPFFIIHLDDTTGTTSGVYFSKKATLNHIRCLKVGDAIITRGNIGEYNGRRSFTFDKINRCTFPTDFVKKDRFKKTAPSEYKLIFPTEATTVKVKSVFDEEEILPNELTDKEYVVFDLETTGLDLMSNGITEIGAVKIKNGKIAEQFTTLIKPDYPITDEIVRLTGITEEMVKDAPKISTVIPDFMKFIKDTVLVGHNVNFDLGFIKRFAAGEEYEVKNRVMDTMEMARIYVPSLKDAKLNTVAEHFSVVFHHHRALADAYATAEIFIELMKLKG